MCGYNTFIKKWKKLMRLIMNNVYLYTPQIKETSIFKEIAQNIVNPLEIVREGVSNACDADAKNISIITYRNEVGNFLVEMIDDGEGMNLEDIHRFFNLGDSNKNFIGIGKKGLGTKTYYKSNNITIITKSKDGKAYKSIMNKPWKKLNDGCIPQYSVEEIKQGNIALGTTIIIEDYIVDNPEKYFNFDTIKDYILWYTAAGSFKIFFSNYTQLYKLIKNIQIAPRIFLNDKVLGLEAEIAGTHHFSPPQEIPEEDIDEPVYKKSVNYCRHFGPFHRETNINGEYVSVQIYGTVSGNNCRKAICKLKQGETLKSRFGLYLAKDFIPFAKNTELLHDSLYSHYHILVNSQNFELTADRNNISNDNTPIVAWVYQQAKDIIDNYIKPLAESGYFKMRKEDERDYVVKCRKESVGKSLRRLDKLENLMLEEIPITKKPYCESQVAILFASLLSNNHTRSFIKYINKIVMFSTHTSTDMICLDKNNKEVMVEVEYRLSNIFLHKHPTGTFDYIVCWEIDNKENRNILTASNSKFNDEDEWVIKLENDKVVPVIELKNIVNTILSKNQDINLAK
jgi:hypothetical protein